MSRERGISFVGLDERKGTEFEHFRILSTASISGSGSRDSSIE